MRREDFEAGFETWAGTVRRGRWWILALGLLFPALAVTQLSKLEVVTSTESYLLENDPTRVAYDELRAQFGRDQMILLAIEPPEVFDLGFLEELRKIHEALEEEVPHLDRVTSLVNIRAVEGRGDELLVDDLLLEMPTTPAELAALRERVLTTPSYRDVVITADGKTTAVMVETNAYSYDESFDALSGFDAPAADDGKPREFLKPAENAAAVEAVKAVAERFRRPDLPIHVTGSAMVTHELALGMARDVPRFSLAALAVILVSMLVLFRRFAPVPLALASVFLSMATTFGVLGTFERTLSILSQILPVFVLAVGIGYAVHLLAIYLQRLDAGDASEAALVAALRHAGPPVAMTALTTSAGIASFLAADMVPIREFGKAAALGVLVCLVYSLAFLPALLCVFPMRARAREAQRETVFDRWLVGLGMYGARHPRQIGVGAALLALGAVVSATDLTPSNDPISYFPEDDPFRQAFEYVDERLGGAMTIEVVIDGKEENAFYDPDLMNRVEALSAHVDTLVVNGDDLGRTVSILDITKETHQALNGNDSAFYAVPQERALLAQELLLFENSGHDDLERVIDPQFRVARFSIRSAWDDGNKKAVVIEQVQRDVARILGDKAEAVVTGASSLIARTVQATSTSLIRTYALAFLVITPLMMLLIGSLRSGLVSMVPNLLPILLTLGLMPRIDAPLDIFTMMFGCIAIGLAVDDTLHMIHGYRSGLARHGDAYRALEETLRTTGRALLFTSVVLSLGFLVFTLSTMENLRYFGVLTAFAVSGAFILDVIITPALLVLVTKKRAVPV
ncbi:MAG: efflux RND transporter permease subunit [Myxococcota bacterium]